MLINRGSREYSEETLKEACNYQSTLEANMGGTEILQPLKEIYGKPAMATHTRQVGDSTSSRSEFCIIMFGYFLGFFVV